MPALELEVMMRLILNDFIMLLASFVCLKVWLVRLVFSAGTIFFSHNNSAETVFFSQF